MSRYEDDHYNSREHDPRGGSGDRYYGGYDTQDAPSDLVLYAPQYRDQLPSNSRKTDRGDYVQYTSNFTPEIVMKGNKEYRENAVGGRSGYVREEEDPYRYERNLPRDDDRRYPRQEKGFGRSLQEERDTVGEHFSDAGENESVNIEYGIFKGRNGSGGRPLQYGPDGRPYDDLERTLGYYP